MIKLLKKFFSRRKILLKFYSRYKGWKTAYFKISDTSDRIYFTYYLPHNHAKNLKMIIALHGLRGSMYEFTSSQLASFADENIFLIVCPEVNTATFYSAEGERIVLEVLNFVKNKFNVDDKKMYLLGYSMGGRGAGLIGFNNSDMIAGIICINGTLTQDRFSLFESIRKKIPIFLAHGREDKIIELKESLVFSDYLKKHSFTYKLLIVDGAGHNLKVLDHSLDEISRFFEFKRVT